MPPCLPTLFALGLAACSQPFPDEGNTMERSPLRDPPSRADPAALGDTAVESVPAADNDLLFSGLGVHQVEILLPESSFQALSTDPYTYVPGDVVFDGVTLSNVGVRLKGRYGSFRPITDKCGFKIDLREYEDQTFQGLERLTFSNIVQDSSFVHDPTAYAIYRAMGVPAPRIGYVWIKVNGVDKGLYEHVETYDDVFLQAHLPNPDGNLYDGDYYIFDSGDYTLVDFEDGLQDYFQLDEGEDVGRADIQAITAAMNTSYNTPAFYDTVGATLDWALFLRFWAVEAWVGQYDGYNYNRNNYRVYFNPDTGLAQMMPWDHDWSFSDSTPLTSPYGRLGWMCYQDPTCRAQAMEVFSEVVSRLDPGTELHLALEEDLADRIATVNPYLVSDPYVGSNLSSFQVYQGALASWLESRSSFLRSTFGLSGGAGSR